LTLGKQVAALVVARGKSDGTDAKWTGTVPVGPGKWTGTNPILPMAGTWKPWVISAPSEFRPEPPLAHDSPEKAAELAELKSFARTPQTNNEALFWEAAVGGLRAHQYWNEQLSKKTLEYRLNENPPRAARAFALPFITLYDAAIACWEAKYVYWAIRPVQLDPEVKPLFSTPNHPSYPAAHACSSIAVTKVLGYLFPRCRGPRRARRTGRGVAHLGRNPLPQRHHRWSPARHRRRRQSDRARKAGWGRAIVDRATAINEPGVSMACRSQHTGLSRVFDAHTIGVGCG
jgi:hypothetical protein